MTAETSSPSPWPQPTRRSAKRPSPDRLTVAPDQSFVVFLIGARVNRFWMLPVVIGVGMAMQRMLRELLSDPDSGLLHVEGRGPGTMVQYWRSVEDLMHYARDKERSHAPAWRRWIREWAEGAVGIWHETYVVGPGQYECVYHHMPERGLGRALGQIPAEGPLRTAKGRLAAGREAVAPVRAA